MCLVAFAWGMIWGHLFRSYIVPIVENKYVEKNWNKMMNRDFLTYWLPLILGGFFIALITQGESFVLLGIYGGLWGLIYGTFYWKIIKPKLDKMENADE